MPGISRALRMGTGASDRVTIANAPANQSLSPFTILFCGVCNDLAGGGRTLLQKGSNAANSVHRLVQNSTTADLILSLPRATTSLQYITNDSPLQLGRVLYACATADIAATPSGHIYTGSDIKSLTERTYGTATDGSGAAKDDSASSLFLGNNFANSAPWVNVIWAVGYLDYVLPLTDALAWQKNLMLGGRLASGGRGGYWLPGINGTGLVIDQSGAGNHGILTVATTTAPVLLTNVPHSLKAS